MTEVLIHIGMPKAGSTSLQRTLAANRKTLHRAGLHYGHFDHPKGPLEAHTAAFLALCDRPERFVRNKTRTPDFERQRQRFTAAFEDNLATGRKVVFSSEILFGLKRGDLETIRDFFVARGVGLRIVAIVRSPLACCNSVAQEALRAGATRLMTAQRPADLISRPIANLRKVFPQTEFYPFARCVGHTAGPGGFLADLLAPGVSENLAELRGNPGFSDNAAVLIAHLNRVVPLWMAASDGDRLSPLRRLRDTTPLQALPGDRFFVRRSWLGDDFARIEAENAWLAGNLGPAFCDPSLEIDDRPVRWTDAHAGQLRRILRAYPPHIRAAIAGYFTLDADHPAALRALADANRLYRGDSYDPVPVRLAQAFARTRRRVTRRLFGAASRSG